MKQIKIFLSLIVVLGALLPVASKADEVKSEFKDEANFASAMTDDELENYRGGFSPVVQLSTMSALVTGNSANNAVTGANTIGDGAFNNVSGLTSVIQNSGNNVVIQSSFQVNVNLQ